MPLLVQNWYPQFDALLYSFILLWLTGRLPWYTFFLLIGNPPVILRSGGMVLNYLRVFEATQWLLLMVPPKVFGPGLHL